MLLQDNHIAFCINFKQKLPYENQRKIDMILADDKKALLLLDILKSNLWNFTTDITEEEQFITMKRGANPVEEIEESDNQQSISGSMSESNMPMPQFSESSIKPQILVNLTSSEPIEWLKNDQRIDCLNYNEYTGRKQQQQQVISISSSLTHISQSQPSEVEFHYNLNKSFDVYKKQRHKQVNDLKRQIAHRMSVYLSNDLLAHKSLPKKSLIFAHLQGYLRRPEEPPEDKERVLDAVMEVLKDVELWEHYLKISNAKTLKLDFIEGIKRRLLNIYNEYRRNKLKME